MGERAEMHTAIEEPGKFIL